jgi:dihydropteroate synthase
MGVVNVTPDSFSDGGRFLEPDAGVEQALSLVEAGADLIDIGGESSRPGRHPVRLTDELARVIPVVRGLRALSDVPISVDTVKPEVALAALEAGADIINDINGLADPRMVRVVAQSGAGAVVMHMRGQPETMQLGDLRALDLAGAIKDWFSARLQVLVEQGVAPDQLCLDPGIGFGKSVDQNVALIAELGRFLQLGRPVLIGASRKSFLGALTGREIEDRGPSTNAAHACAVFLGAQLIRVHDVAAALDVVRVAGAIGLRARSMFAEGSSTT